MEGRPWGTLRFEEWDLHTPCSVVQSRSRPGKSHKEMGGILGKGRLLLKALQRIWVFPPERPRQRGAMIRRIIWLRKPEHRTKGPPHELLGTFSKECREEGLALDTGHVVLNASGKSPTESNREHPQAPQGAVLDKPSSYSVLCKCAQIRVGCPM